MKIKVLLVDDHQLLREGLVNILQKTSHIEVVGQASNGREGLQLLNKLQPDIVLMDVAMPGLNGVEATRMMLNDFPDIRIIALSMHDNSQFITGMFTAGAKGYLLKDCATAELIEAIEKVAAGQYFLSYDISSIVLKEFLNSRKTKEPVLTGREREVLQLIAEGSSTKEIASRLFLSQKTVESHRKNIMDKLDIHTIPELTKYAIREGYTSLE